MPEWIQDLDNDVLQWFQDRHTAWLDYNVKELTTLGGTTVLAVVVVFALGMLVVLRRYRHAVLAAILIAGVYFATEAVKDAVGRPRPVLSPKAKPQTDSASFPSSHASRSMGVFVILALCLRRRTAARWYALAGALLVAVLVGLTRLYLGKHFLSDVVAGWLLGLVFAALFWIADRWTGT
jgi:undecaprenyl-diphosphatase